MHKSPAERKATQRQSKKRKHAICYQQILGLLFMEIWCKTSGCMILRQLKLAHR